MKSLNNKKSLISSILLKITGCSVVLLFCYCFVSCSDMFDDIKKYASSETIYADKLDGIVRVQIGYERVEIDLMEAGRVPASSIKMGKAKKTVIECADFTEPDNRRVIDSICSWVNVTGLTELKNYQISIYTEDEYGNRSLPLKTEVKPYTVENRNALSLTMPMILESTSAALMEWMDHISAKTHTVYRYAYRYIDKDGTEHTGNGNGDLPSFFVENVEKGKDIPITFTCWTIPTITDDEGNYTPILDTIPWQPKLGLRISENAEAAIFLKTPEPVAEIILNRVEDFFPLAFSWVKVTEATGYTLKISTDPAFPAGTTRTVNVGDAGDYLMDLTEGLNIINSLPKARQMELYWTVMPSAQTSPIKNQVRKLITSRLPVLVGRWQFNNASNLAAATVGNDLILEGSGFVPVDGPSASNKAVRVPLGSYFRCLHGMQGTNSYTIRFHVKFPATGNHALLQTNTSNADVAQLLKNENGTVSIGGTSTSANTHSMGPNHWHEIVFVSDEEIRRIYIDGEIACSGSSNNTRYDLKPEGVLFFADNGGRDSNIDVAEIAIWDVAMTEEEIHKASNLQKLNYKDLSISDFSGETATVGLVDYLINGALGEPAWYIDTSKSPTPHYAIIDLGAQRNIGRVIVHTSIWSGSNPRDVEVSVGNNPRYDTGGWTRVGTLSREGANWNPWGSMMTFDFPETSVRGRYLLIYLPNAYSWVAMNEVVVFAKVE